MWSLYLTKNLPINDDSLVKAGAKTIIESLKDKPQIGGATYEAQMKALSECKISKAIVGKWDSCETAKIYLVLVAIKRAFSISRLLDLLLVMN